jgi:hypothetical protein
MLSFFSGLLGFNTTSDAAAGAPALSEHARLTRVAEELARLEHEERPPMPLSPTRRKRKAEVEAVATPVLPKLKLRKLMIEEARLPLSDMENTPTAEMCSLRTKNERSSAEHVPAKRKRGVEEEEQHDDAAEQLTPPVKKASVAIETEDEAPLLGEKRKTADGMEGEPISLKRPAVAPGANTASSVSSSSSKRKASDMESHENGDRARLSPAIKVTHLDAGAKAAVSVSASKKKADNTPKHAPGATPSSKSKKSPAYYRNLAKACRSKRLQFTAI